ncbi:DNA cytosine methyltransferase [Chryseobacterium sp. 3008163]|uniref:DNA cytosine methyltransferase n=1 Tax=Chryseobacterium sp. 3008163 TaxID=2478663 RepID=UPI000F0D1D5C|nr:DNA cytosine methyltransferase [Chryseobacterium sp. 3008163]AYM99380.1 DNA cytosine methyltransferase [Chryseobacterium sp. 3008163]
MSNYTFIDLFAGCGGLSEGFYKEGFKSLVHVDFDEAACLTIKERMKYYDYSQEEIENSVICGDLTKEEINVHIENIVKDSKVDVLVGGPPCQSFSTVGRAQDPNSMFDDPRNYLFLNYLKILEKYMPKVFVFENVSGLLSAKPNGEFIFPKIIAEMSKYYDVCDDKETLLLNSVHYGVPQIRKRVIIVGVRKDLKFTAKNIYRNIIKTHYSPEMETKGNTDGFSKYVTVKEAISDLPKLFPGEGKNEIEFKPSKFNPYLKKIRTSDFDKLFNHEARRHNENDRKRYQLLSKNEWQLKHLAEVSPELVHHDPKHFGNRYTVQKNNLPGTTVVAHLYKDGNLFIHPDHKQERTFTVREAARIQSFPDDFVFMGSRTNQFKQVGNAVPPLMAQQIAKAIKKFL